MNVLVPIIVMLSIVTIKVGAVCGIVAVLMIRRLKQTVRYLETKSQRLQNSLSEIEYQLEKIKERGFKDEAFQSQEIPEPTVAETTEAAPPLKTEQEEQKPVVEETPPEPIAEPPITPPSIKPATEPVTASVLPPKQSYAAIQAVSSDTEERAGAAEEPAAEETCELEMDLETRIGAVWFNRIGLIGLIVGFALLGRMFEFQPWHKTAASYLASAALFVIGWIYERKLQRFARPVQAGGLALAFFTSFAAHFLKPMSCIGMEASLALMTASVFAILYCAERWKSESTAMLAIFFGHTAAFTAGGGADSFSLIAIVFLCLASLAMFLRHNWLPLGVFSACAAFLSHVLWALRNHAPTTPEASFWVNFTFLSSYYFIFLCADLIYQNRFMKQGSEAFTKKQIATGRLLGPVSVILYASTVCGLFFATQVFWENIYLYLFPLAVLQAGLIFYQQSRGNRDYPLYAVFSTTFLTLGLFSCIGGLSLNLTLAAEALVLLLASRKMQLWYLNPLAQAVLTVNFFHFWMSDTYRIQTWPEYLGCMAVAAVYYVKSYLEETWRFADSPTEERQPLWIAALRGFYTKLMTSFSYLHAFAGATLIAFQAVAFLKSPWEETVVALAIVLSTAAVIRLKTKAMIPAIWWTILLAAALWVTAIYRNVDMKSWTENWRWFGWIVQNVNLLAILACAWTAFYFAEKQRRAILFVFGFGMLFPSLFMIFTGLRPPQSHYLVFPIWAIPPLSLWFFSVYTERLKRVLEWEWSGWLWGFLERASVKNLSAISTGIAIVGAFATNHAFLSLWPIESEAYWLLAAVAICIASYAAMRNTVSLIPGLAVLVCLYSNSHIFSLIREHAEDARALTWGIAASSVIVTGIILLGVYRTKRSSFLAASLTFAAIAVGITTMILLNRLTDFTPYIAWLCVPVCLWIAVENTRAAFSDPLKDKISWKDSFDFTTLSKEGPLLIHTLSFVVAFLLFMITVRYTQSASDALWLISFYTVLLSAAAYLRRSTVLAVGTPLLLLGSHLFYFAKIHPTAGARAFPLLSVSLTALTGALSGVAEKIIATKKDSLSGMQLYAYAGNAFYYLLAFFLGGVFMHCRSLIDLNDSAWIFPYQIAFPLLVFTVGWFFRLELMQSFAYGFTLLYFLPKAAERFITRPEYQTDLLGAGVVLFLSLIYMERVLRRQKNASVSLLTPQYIAWMRKIAIIASGALMLLVLTLSEELRGYWTTFGWSLLAFLLVSLGFIWKDKTYRRTALAIFSLSIVRIVAIDVAQLEALYRTVAFLCLGACLIAVSFLYSRFGKEIRKWL